MSSKRVIRDLSELSILKDAATGPSEEGSEGGFVVGKVIETGSILEEEITEEVIHEEVVETLVNDIVSPPTPKDGDSFYEPETDRYGRVTIESDDGFFTNRLGGKFKLEELAWDESRTAWVLIVPSWALAMVGNYRSFVSEIPNNDKVSDRVLFDMIEEAKGMMPEEINTYITDRVTSYLDKFFDEARERSLAILDTVDPDEWAPDTESNVDDHLVEGTTENDAEDRAAFNESDDEDVEFDTMDEDVEVGDFDVIDITDSVEDGDEEAEIEEEEKKVEKPNLHVVSSNEDFQEWSKEVLKEAGKPPAELKEIPEDPAASPTLTVVTGDVTATVENGEATIVAADGETVIQEVPIETNETLIAEIERFMVPGALSSSTPLKNMTTRELRFHLQFLKNNYGGSADAAAILRDIEADYEKIINDPAVKKRLALLEQKGVDFYVLAQKMSKIMGNDITIKGFRYQEYHQLLQHLTRTVSVLFNEITTAADYMGIAIPLDELVPSMGAVPIIEGMQIDEKTAMYVLRCLVKSLEHWHHIALTTDTRLIELGKQSETWKDKFEKTKKHLDEEVENRDGLLNSIRSRFTEHPEYFIHVVSGNSYIGLIDEDEILSIANMEVVTDIREALFLSHKEAANRIIEALKEHPKFSSYTYSIRRVASVEV